MVRNLRLILSSTSLLLALSLATPAIPERSDSPDMYALFRQPATSTTVTTTRRLRPAIAEMASLVDTEADRFALPRELVHYHIRRESSYDPVARNPRSTAKGLTQIIRGTHGAITRQPLTRGEHFAKASDPTHNLRVGLAHVAAAYRANPGWSADRLWRRCHVAGLANCGTSLNEAARIYESVTTRSGWIQLGSVAWSSGSNN